MTDDQRHNPAGDIDREEEDVVSASSRGEGERVVRQGRRLKVVQVHASDVRTTDHAVVEDGHIGGVALREGVEGVVVGDEAVAGAGEGAVEVPEDLLEVRGPLDLLDRVDEGHALEASGVTALLEHGASVAIIAAGEGRRGAEVDDGRVADEEVLVLREVRRVLVTHVAGSNEGRVYTSGDDCAHDVGVVRVDVGNILRDGNLGPIVLNEIEVD